MRNKIAVLILLLPSLAHSIPHSSMSGAMVGNHTGVVKMTSGSVSAAATTTDLPEGSALYYSDSRADARIAAQKGANNGIAPLGPAGKIAGAYLPTNDVTSVSGQTQMQLGGTLVIGITLSNAQVGQLCYIVPPGHNVRLVSTTVTGSPSFSIIAQAETAIAFGP